MKNSSELTTTVTGQIASRGLAIGPLHVVADEAMSRAGTGDPAQEAALLRAAMAVASTDITRIMAAQAAEDAAEILEFQLALLEDETLSEPAFGEIAEGHPADDAWRRALGLQIEDYRSAEDEYFRARADDLYDLRDRVLRHLVGADVALEEVPAEAIVLSGDLTPTRFLEFDWNRCGGIALTAGSTASHVAILARARGVPMLVGLGQLAAPAGKTAILDAEDAQLIVNPDADRLLRAACCRDEAVAQRARDEAYLTKPAVAADGVSIKVSINLDAPSLLDSLDPAHCDGIGLVRTEFLFRDPGGLPDEEAQLAVYRRILAWAGGRPVTFRTLDAGGDKPIAGLTQDSETNPFLGVRGLRLSLRHPGVFEVQLRALARAAVDGDVKIMFPMVTAAEELAQAREIFARVIGDLGRARIAAAAPPLGIMIEVPAAAISIGAFDAGFFSIGSNDLVQYVTACSRDNHALADLYDFRNPAVLELLSRVARHGRKHRREVSLCGDMASDPEGLPLVLEAGLRSLSIAPAALARTKSAIARLKVGSDG